MNELTFIFLLVLLAAERTQCFPATTSQDGNRSAKVFYCKIPGCAANVTLVYCNDKPLLIHNILNCKGPPPPNTVCQHDRRAFVSIDTDGDCDFEGEYGYITTEKCTEHSIICAFLNVTTEETFEDCANCAYILTGVCVSLLIVILILIAVARFCTNGSTANNQQPASDSDVTEPLREIQSLGETSESDTCNGGPGLDGGSSASRCDRRA